MVMFPVAAIVVAAAAAAALGLHTPWFSSTSTGSLGCKSVCFYFTPLSLSRTYASWCLGSTVASAAHALCLV